MMSQMMCVILFCIFIAPDLQAEDVYEGLHDAALAWHLTTLNSLCDIMFDTHV